MRGGGFPPDMRRRMGCLGERDPGLGASERDGGAVVGGLRWRAGGGAKKDCMRAGGPTRFAAWFKPLLIARPRVTPPVCGRRM